MARASRSRNANEASDSGPWPTYARRAWLGAATMESELETQVSNPVVFVNRHGLYEILAVLGGAILDGAFVLGCSFRNFAMLKQNA
ncbi:hypothetical protein MRX96_007814 [Rhipicephalus microplus]